MDAAVARPGRLGSGARGVAAVAASGASAVRAGAALAVGAGAVADGDRDYARVRFHQWRLARRRPGIVPALPGGPEPHGAAAGRGHRLHARAAAAGAPDAGT